MWTFPKAILSSNRELLFCNGTMQYFTKIDLLGVVWDDGEVSRMLTEHYTSTLLLGSLELIVVALTALGSRQTNLCFVGDLSYALMALLHHRPRNDRTSYSVPSTGEIFHGQRE